MVEVICSKCGEQIITKRDLAWCRGTILLNPVCRKCFVGRMEKFPVWKYHEWSNPLTIGIMAITGFVCAGVFLQALVAFLAFSLIGLPLSLVEWAIPIVLMLFGVVGFYLSVVSWTRLYLKYGRYLK